MDDIKARLLKYAKFKGYNASKFANYLGLSKGYFSGVGDVGSDILREIKLKCPDLNLEWAIIEEGEMIKEEYLLPKDKLIQLINPADTQAIMKLRLPVEDTLIILRNEISMLKQEISAKDRLIKGINEMIAKNEKKS
jgi:hypothetical protein